VKLAAVVGKRPDIEIVEIGQDPLSHQSRVDDQHIGDRPRAQYETGRRTAERRMLENDDRQHVVDRRERQEDR